MTQVPSHSAVIGPNENKTPEHFRELFQTDEILWFNDGRWGKAGYAIPNAQGKTWTLNPKVYQVHQNIGKMLFHLMHAQDVQFADPPHKDWWWEWHKALVHGRKNLLAARIAPGTTKNIKENHISANRRTFLVYPVPYFGERIRQADIRLQCELALVLLGHIMQHSANERNYYVTDTLVDGAVGMINEMIAEVAVKYFNADSQAVKTANETTDGYTIPADQFSEENYTPRDFIPSTEFTIERPGLLWWPTENDLSAIRGIAYTDALYLAARWPDSFRVAEGDWESTLPGIKNRVRSGDFVQPPDLPPSGDDQTSGQFPPD